MYNTFRNWVPRGFSLCYGECPYKNNYNRDNTIQQDKAKSTWLTKTWDNKLSFNCFATTLKLE